MFLVLECFSCLSIQIYKPKTTTEIKARQKLCHLLLLFSLSLFIRLIHERCVCSLFALRCRIKPNSGCLLSPVAQFAGWQLWIQCFQKKKKISLSVYSVHWRAFWKMCCLDLCCLRANDARCGIFRAGQQEIDGVLVGNLVPIGTKLVAPALNTTDNTP